MSKFTDNTPQAKEKPLRPLTRKQAAFVKHLIDNPKDSATKAALATYGTQAEPPTYGTAMQIAHDNLSKPNIQLELAKYSSKAELVLVEAMGAEKKIYKFNPDTKSNEYLGSEADHAIRLRAADSVLDRVHGKATQRTEIETKAVVLSIDLTGTTEVAQHTTEN